MAMRDWLLFKQRIVDASGIDGDALAILVSLLLCLLAALAMRRALSSGLPWLAVVVLGLADGLAEGLADGYFSRSEVGPIAGALLLFLLLPTLLLLLGKFAPDLLSAHQDRRILVPAVWEKKAPVVDAVFKEQAPMPDSKGVAG
ncbi:MAG: hypothetical protein ACT4OE_04125 [Sphingosinicella sp.]